MCGIVFSIINDTYANHTDEFFKDALLASQVRGMHSTGMMQVDKKSQLSTFKAAMHASDYVEMTRAQALLRDVPRSPLTVGHVRHATMGQVVDKNAHPFVVLRPDGTKLAGVHNGTLRGWKGKEGGADEDVDSAWAFNVLAEKGFDEAFRHFNGAYAFVWYDELYPDHVFMARNDERPLHYYVSPDKKVMLGASELGMLGWLVEKHGFELDRKHGTQMFYLGTKDVYKFSLKNLGECDVYTRKAYDPTTTLPVPAATATAIVPYKRTPDYMEGYTSEWDNWHAPFSGGGTNRSGSTSSWSGGQQAILTKVKEALRDARQPDAPTAFDPPAEGVNEDSALVTTDELDARLEAGIQSAINTFQRRDLDIDPWQLVKQDLFVGNPKDKTASSEEIKAARDAHMYGRAVGFIGVMWDEDTSDTLGEMQMMRGGKLLTLDCIVRGATEAVANARYIKVDSPRVLAIVGMMEGYDRDTNIYILAELDSQQRGMLRDRMMPRTAIH